MAFYRRRSPFPGLLGLLLAAAGCRAVETHAQYPQDLYHPDYVKRSKAVAEFAEQEDRSQLPQAFQLLLDDDANIRLVAYSAIRGMSPGAEDFGYRPYLRSDVRYGIVVRWQAWWVKSGGTAEAPKTAEGEKPSGAMEAGAEEPVGAREAEEPAKGTEEAHG